MKNSIEKILYILGISMMLLFFIFLIVKSFFEQQPHYTLIIYSYPNHVSEQDLYKEINDPENKISGYSIGVLNIPDDRIHVSNTPLFVLVKKKSREITYVTDSLDKLNEYIINELK